MSFADWLEAPARVTVSLAGTSGQSAGSGVAPPTRPNVQHRKQKVGNFSCTGRPRGGSINAVARVSLSHRMGGTSMFTVWGAKQRFCDGVSRRNFLKIGAFGAGLTLADMLRLQAQGGISADRKDRAVIVLWVHGGPSHLSRRPRRYHPPTSSLTRAIPCAEGNMAAKNLKNASGVLAPGGALLRGAKSTPRPGGRPPQPVP